MNIENIVDKGLCISCGICAGNCPTNCIELIKSGFQYIPQINKNICVGCNICNEVCPSNQWEEYNTDESISKYIIGDYKGLIQARTKDVTILQEATSGGIITQLIQLLLNETLYDSAFVIKGHSYTEAEIKTQRYIKGDLLSESSKSRYLVVSHEDAIRYMIQHKNERIILIGTGCIVRGIINTIKFHNLDRNNYLIMGLFCDKTMHNGVIEYFNHHPIHKGRQIKEFFFRSKDAGGWPGNIKIVYQDNSIEFLNNTERIEVKDYFMPERCLYCLDKLNRNCDIAVGDDYTLGNNDRDGGSTVILRTDKAMEIWLQFCPFFIWKDGNVQDLQIAQNLKNKKMNYQFAILKGIFPSKYVDKTIQGFYKEALKKIDIGKREKNIFFNIKYDLQKRRTFNRIYNLTHHPKLIINKIFNKNKKIN